MSIQELEKLPRENLKSAELDASPEKMREICSRLEDSSWDGLDSFGNS
jgi:hypothetical protein